MTSLANNPRRRTKPTGDRVELARYTAAAGERILYGQSVYGVVSFLPDQPLVLAPQSTKSEDSGCRPRGSVEEKAPANAARPKRRNGHGGPPTAADASASTRRRTGARVELARYTVSAGERVLYGQRVFGVVSFLPDDLVVLELGRAVSEDSSCRPRSRESRGARPDAVRPKRSTGADNCGGATDQCPEDRS